MRKVIHIDMDAFYAAVEQRDHPEYRGKPIIVGGRPESRGVVATASYEARKFGIHSAMSSAKAARLCPQAIFVTPHFDIYHQVSEQIREIFASYTPLVEPMSLDEAYLDVSDCNRLAREIAKEIKDRIFATTQLTASAGVGPNKFLAKVASDFRKPNGLTVVPPSRAVDFLAPLPVRKIPGVGPVTEKRLQAAGFTLIRDLQLCAETDLIELFGNMGEWLHRAAHGQDESPVEPEHIRKSLGSEETFAHDLTKIEEMEQELRRIAGDVAGALTDRDLAGRTITVKVTYSDFSKITRRLTLEQQVSDRAVIADIACELLQRTEAAQRPVRLLGISLSGFDEHVVPAVLPQQLRFSFME